MFTLLQVAFRATGQTAKQTFTSPAATLGKTELAEFSHRDHAIGCLVPFCNP
jgi:hypothetical protein